VVFTAASDRDVIGDVMCNDAAAIIRANAAISRQQQQQQQQQQVRAGGRAP